MQGNLAYMSITQAMDESPSRARRIKKVCQVTNIPQVSQSYTQCVNCAAASEACVCIFSKVISSEVLIAPSRYTV